MLDAMRARATRQSIGQAARQVGCCQVQWQPNSLFALERVREGWEFLLVSTQAEPSGCLRWVRVLAMPPHLKKNPGLSQQGLMCHHHRH